jgi:serine kinase of HPr protein (carbohydrate metabolism regulator)
VSDDQTHVVKRGRALVASAPAALAGLIEVRGVGIVKLGNRQRLARAPVALLVDLVPAREVERLPEPSREIVEKVELQRVALAPFEASAVSKLRLALARAARAR